MTNTIEIENLNISDLDIPTDETLQEVATACENIATSSESIATSCDNVATSCNSLAKDTTLQSTNTALGSLATDATLQATNTALGGLNTSLGCIIKDATGQSIDTSVGNISTVLSDVATDTTLATVAKDTTLQATNTALSSLMADTTGQSIASAISGLANAVKPDASDIPYDSNTTVKGKIDEIANTSIISIGNEIASGTSLNNVTTPGIYYFTASSAISDAPFTNNSACNLYVLPRSGITSRVFQIVISYLSTGCNISIRAMSGASSWTAWHTI